MSKVVARSLFNTAVVERSWRNHITSGAVHVVIIAAAFLITFPAAEVLRKPVSDHVTLIAPVIPVYHPKIEAPRLPHVAKLVIPPAPQPVKIAPPVIPPPIPQPKPVAKVEPPPVVHPTTPEPKIMADVKPDLPPPPKPVVKTGVFQATELAKAAPVQKQVVVGGFGDPRGLHPNDNSKAPVLMAKVGSFESPLGNGQTGGGGRSDAGSVKQSGFGAVSDASSGLSGRSAGVVHTAGFGDGVAGGAAGGNGHGAGAVRSSGFGDTVSAAAGPRRDVAAAPAAFTPVEILFKPKPSYSSEARTMGLEGQVQLEVVFQASGAVRVVRVIKGLGHGLDEAAQQAATQVRFKPATKSGAPVDMNATISITFELT